MTKVLIVEDSRSFAELLARRVRLELGFEAHVAHSLTEAVERIGQGDEYLAALVDLRLPDAPEGQSVELALAYSIPPIVFTADLSDAMRENFWSRHIVDYVLKDGPENVDYVVRLLGRLNTNPQTKVLVVDDSRSYRHAVLRLLAAHRYHALEAASGEEALAALEANPDLKLALVDYNMPGMDGFELTREMRRRLGKDVLAIIGVSAVGGARLSARFIKSGANDYLTKPFLVEEFYTRITQNLEMLEHIAQVRYMAERDYLTRAYNRRYFFSAGAQLHALLTRRSQPVTVAMLDIDHFKAINDALGHEAGDAVLRQMAQLLESRFRVSDIVARVGGEEFCVLASGMGADRARLLFDELRAALAASPVEYDGQSIPYTVSIGLCCAQGLSLDDMLREADRMLYRSKAAGRNRVTLFEPAPFDGPVFGAATPDGDAPAL